jgi:metal-sulfur cluster biosynthetic enzyme
VVSVEQLTAAVGAVHDPHLPFGLADMGMVERVEILPQQSIEVVINVPCHHCPGLQMLRDDIEAALRSVGVTQPIQISFHGREAWHPVSMTPEVRAAMRSMGIQTLPTRSATEGAPT